ncbi:MAG: hypothetical protein NC489_43765, partial [Ruminococcus flavefaciens]|nr:hypothetical protein [Ruminococcus flavefaciens]
EEEARLERMNAAYERDRAALAKTDPAFSRGTFRDIGHAEGSEDGYISMLQMDKRIRKIVPKIGEKLKDE